MKQFKKKLNRKSIVERIYSKTKEEFHGRNFNGILDRISLAPWWENQGSFISREQRANKLVLGQGNYLFFFAPFYTILLFSLDLLINMAYVDLRAYNICSSVSILRQKTSIKYLSDNQHQFNGKVNRTDVCRHTHTHI